MRYFLIYFIRSQVNNSLSIWRYSISRLYQNNEQQQHHHGFIFYLQQKLRT